MTLACNPEEPAINDYQVKMDQAIKSLQDLGYRPEDYIVEGEGVVIQGDVFSTFDQIIDLAEVNSSTSDIPETEQYRTDLIAQVDIHPKTKDPYPFRVYLERNLPERYQEAAIAAINRFNNVNSLLRFEILPPFARPAQVQVRISRDDGIGTGTLGRAGFPIPILSGKAAKIYPTVKLNIGLLDAINYTDNAITSIIAHELGHCVGFRHTDWFDRSISCGGNATNEGDAGVGAIHIPGTPTGADPNSWMLSCTPNVDRPFTAGDINAIQGLF